MVFHLTTDTQPPDCEIVSLRGADGTLTLRYDSGAFTLIGTDDIAVRLPYTTATRDFLALGIEQTATARTLRLASLAQQTDRKQTTEAPPCMTMTTIAWYPR